MQLTDTENRVVTKSFRTTAAIAEALKNISAVQKKQVTESDIINDALQEYINACHKRNHEFSKSWNDFNINEVNKYFERINTLMPVKINSPKDVANYFKGKLPKDREALYILYLDTNNFIIKTQLLGVGNDETVHGDYSIAIQTALSLNPCHIIAMHNHPGSGVTPSEADIRDTKKFFLACQFSNVFFTDAVILDDNYKHYSFDKHGLIKEFENNFYKIDEQYIQKKTIK